MLNLDTVKIGFIGYGNMSGATARGLIRSGAIRPEQIYASAKNYDGLCQRAAADGIHPCSSSMELVNLCDVIFIGVKPYLVEEVMSPLASALKDKLIISLATNLFDDDLERIMPGNPPRPPEGWNSPSGSCPGTRSSSSQSDHGHGHGCIQAWDAPDAHTCR